MEETGGDGSEREEDVAVGEDPPVSVTVVWRGVSKNIHGPFEFF